MTKRVPSRKIWRSLQFLVYFNMPSTLKSDTLRPDALAPREQNEKGACGWHVYKSTMKSGFAKLPGMMYNNVALFVITLIFSH